MRIYRVITRAASQSDNWRWSAIARGSIGRAGWLVDRVAVCEVGAGFAHCYRTKILFAVGGFMGFADVRPFPIPSLVRYKLIDSSSVVVYRPVSGWYATLSPAPATANGEKGCRGEIETGLHGLCTPPPCQTQFIPSILAPTRPSNVLTPLLSRLESTLPRLGYSSGLSALYESDKPVYSRVYLLHVTRSRGVVR